MPNGDKYTLTEFSQLIKKKYPQYSDVEDSILVRKILEKYPQYRDNVLFEEQVEKTTGEPEKPTTYFNQITEFMSKMPGFALDWGERFASSVLKLPKMSASGLEQYDRDKEAVFDIVKKEYETLGLSEESAKGLTDVLKRTIPVGGQILKGFDVAKGVYDKIKDTDEFKSIEKTAEKLYEKSDRYKGKGIVELAKEGDWDSATGSFILYGAESLPQSILAATGGPAGAFGLGLMAAGEKYDELLEREDMSEAIRMVNSNLNGVIEAFTEYIGSVQIGRIWRETFKKVGKEQLKDLSEKTARNWISNLFKKAGIWGAPFQEGAEEFANAIGENVVAKYTGEDPERNLGENVIENTLRGMSGGSYFTGGALTTKGIQKLTERVEETREIEEEKPVTDEVEKPKVEEQPPIPVYKIGEQEFKNKNTFLSEVEKYEGVKEIPEIVVENDEEIERQVAEILKIEKPEKGIEEKELPELIEGKYITESDTENKLGMENVPGYVEVKEDKLLLSDRISESENRKTLFEDISTIEKINALRDDANKSIDEINKQVEQEGEYEVDGSTYEGKSELNEIKKVYERRLYRLDEAEKYLEGKELNYAERITRKTKEIRGKEELVEGKEEPVHLRDIGKSRETTEREGALKEEVQKEEVKKPVKKKIPADVGEKLREMDKETKQIKESTIKKLEKASKIWSKSGETDYDIAIANLKKAGFKIVKRKGIYLGDGKYEETDNLVINYGKGKQMQIGLDQIDNILKQVKKKWPSRVPRPQTEYRIPSGRKVKQSVIEVRLTRPDGTLKTKDELMEEYDWRIGLMKENLETAKTEETKKTFQAEIDNLESSRSYAENYYDELIKEQKNIEEDEKTTRDIETIADEAESIRDEAELAGTEEEITASEEKIDKLVDEIDLKIQEYKEPVEEEVVEKQEIEEEPKEKPTKKEKTKESLLASFSGVKRFFDIPKQKRRGKQEKQRDELVEWLNKQKQEELDVAETEEEKKIIEQDYKKKISDTKKLFSREKYTASQRATEIRRKIIKDYIDDNRSELKRVYGNVVPAMLNRVNSAKTIRQVNDALDYMGNVMKRQQDREEAILWGNKFDQVEKLLDPMTYKEKGAKPLKAKRGITKDFLNMLDMFKENLTRKTRDEGRRLATELMDNVMARNEELTVEEYEKLEEYRTYGITEMTGEELAWTVNYIKTRLKGERTQEFNRKFAEKQEETEKFDHFGDIIRSKKPKKESIYDERKTLKVGPARMLIDFFNKNKNIFTILNSLSQYEYETNPDISHIYGSEMERYWIHKIHEADNNYHDGVRELTTKGHDIYKKIFGEDRKGVDLKRHLLKRAKELKYDLVEIKYKGLAGAKKTTEFTQEEMAYVYRLLQNDDMYESLSKIDPREESGGLIRYMAKTDTYEKTDLANKIEEALDDDMKQWADYMGEMFDKELYDRYNEVYKKFFVFDMPKSRMYVPIFRETNENLKMGIEEMLQKETFSSMGYNRHLYQRKPNKNPIKILPLSDTFFSYIEKMERFRARAETLQEMKRFFNNKDVRNAIYEKGGKSYINIINQFLDRYAGLRTGSIVKSIDYIRRQFTRASLALKPTIFIKQLMSFPAYSNFIPTAQLVKGMGKFWLNPKKNWKMLSESSYVLNRYNASFDRDIADAMTKDYTSKRPMLDNWLNHAMFMVKWGDRMPIVLAGYAVYDYNYNKFIKQGQSEKDAHKNAIREFELATRFTQQAADVADLGFWQSESSWSKLATMYMTAPLSYQRMTTAGVRSAISGFKGKNWKVFRKGVTTAFVGHVLLPVLFQYASNGFELDDEEERRDLLWAALLGNINNLFIVGDVIQTVIDSVRDIPWGYQAVPIESIVVDMKKAENEIEQVLKKISKGEDFTLEDYLDAVDKISRAPSYFMGLPLPGMIKTFRGIVEAIEDDQATAGKKIKWIVGYSKKGLESADVDKEIKYE